jgi:hypothetical protein
MSAAKRVIMRGKQGKNLRHVCVVKMEHCRIYQANFAGILLKNPLLYLNVTELSIRFYGYTVKDISKDRICVLGYDMQNLQGGLKCTYQI